MHISNVCILYRTDARFSLTSIFLQSRARIVFQKSVSQFGESSKSFHSSKFTVTTKYIQKQFLASHLQTLNIIFGVFCSAICPSLPLSKPLIKFKKRLKLNFQAIFGSLATTDSITDTNPKTVTDKKHSILIQGRIFIKSKRLQGSICSEVFLLKM